MVAGLEVFVGRVWIQRRRHWREIDSMASRAAEGIPIYIKTDLAGLNTHFKNSEPLSNAVIINAKSLTASLLQRDLN